MAHHSHLSSLRKPQSAANARQLRSRMTEAELKFWYHVRRRAFRNLRFRKQVPLGSYVVDFLCEEARLIVEIDGGQHAARHELDEVRSRWLSAQGYRIVRFWNNDVLANIFGVLEGLAESLEPSPCPLPREGERR